MAENLPSSPTAPAAATAKPLVGVNEMRLTGRQWLITIVIFTLFAVAFPSVWKHFEPYAPGPEYRIPYSLSRDYWLYQRRLDRLPAGTIPLIGDSVVWGEYVRNDDSLSHFLNDQSGNPTAFANCGVNGMFPLALEGLLRNYGHAVARRKVILQCNLLWMSNPRVDFSAPGGGNMNNLRLLPQFGLEIPGYQADLNERLSATFERHVPILSWTTHINSAYFGEKSIPQWTLEQDDADPPGLPNAWKNPLKNFAKGIPGEPAVDPQRGPTSYRHRPWTSDGAGPIDFEWVPLDRSLQFAAFLRTVRLLESRGNDLLVILGPFNEHMIAEDQQSLYASIRAQAKEAITKENVTLVVPAALPSNLYADASHPLTEGYKQLAGEIFADGAFQKWLAQ
jgi:hypothetical protein